MSYSAHFHSLGTAREHQTKDEAAADLASMITFLYEHESAEVKIASVRGHVGVFSSADHAAPPVNSKELGRHSPAARPLRRDRRPIQPVRRGQQQYRKYRRSQSKCL
jgi:hypothetical protein